jgi:uncharacterized protein (TIGR00730 family)
MTTHEEPGGALRAVAVYCGFRIGARPAYREAAVTLGRALAARGTTLVYGGGGGGMMRTVADAVLDAGGRVVGVIPVSLVEREEAHDGLSTTPDARGSCLEIVPDMHTRKARMLDLADACAVLPGGMGTMDETFEVLTWAQLGLHRKPCGMINVDGYYDALLRWLDEAVTGGFLAADERELLRVGPDPATVLDALEAWVAATLGLKLDNGDALR